MLAGVGGQARLSRVLLKSYEKEGHDVTAGLGQVFPSVWQPGTRFCLPCSPWLRRGGWFTNYSVQLEALGASLKFCFIALIGKLLVTCMSTNLLPLTTWLCFFIDPSESCYQDIFPLLGRRIKLTETDQDPLKIQPWLNSLDAILCWHTIKRS